MKSTNNNDKNDHKINVFFFSGGGREGTKGKRKKKKEKTKTKLDNIFLGVCFTANIMSIP